MTKGRALLTFDKGLFYAITEDGHYSFSLSENELRAVAIHVTGLLADLQRAKTKNLNVS